MQFFECLFLFALHVGEVISRELQTKNKTVLQDFHDHRRCQEGFQLRPCALHYTPSVVAAAAAASEQSEAKHALHFHSQRDTKARLPRPHWCSQLWLLPLFGYVRGFKLKETRCWIEVLGALAARWPPFRIKRNKTFNSGSVWQE